MAHQVNIGSAQITPRGSGRPQESDVGRVASSGGINAFLSDVIRPGRYVHKHTYQILINAPRGMSKKTSWDLSHRCESITLPGTNVETSPDTIRKGPSREHAFNMNFGPVSGTFLCDKDLKERTFFHEWQRLCVADKADGWGVGYFDSYATDMEIIQFDLAGDKQYHCKLFDCFPKSIGPETLTLADTESMRISVEFVFHRWEQI